MPVEQLDCCRDVTRFIKGLRSLGVAGDYPNDRDQGEQRSKDLGPS
jgi:hypothetical protein